jgi:hypothetical protein
MTLAASRSVAATPARIDLPTDRGRDCYGSKRHIVGLEGAFPPAWPVVASLAAFAGAKPVITSVAGFAVGEPVVSLWPLLGRDGPAVPVSPHPPAEDHNPSAFVNVPSLFQLAAFQ